MKVLDEELASKRPVVGASESENRIADYNTWITTNRLTCPTDSSQLLNLPSSVVIRMGEWVIWDIPPSQ